MTKTSTVTKTVWFISSCSLLWRKAEAGLEVGTILTKSSARWTDLLYFLSLCFLRSPGTLTEASSQQWFLFPDDSILHLDDKNLASTQGFM